MKHFLSPKRTLMLANGQLPEFGFFRRYREHAETLIALDGASTWLIDRGIEPDIVIGDMDSAELPRIESLRHIKITEQNSNDLEKALTYCAREGLHDITVLGAFGLRADHFLTNLFVLKKFAQMMTITLVDEQQCAFICPPRQQIAFVDVVGSFISFFPLNEEVGPISSTGVQYPLQDEMLSLTSRIGTLNKVTASRATVYCERGDLLIMVANFFV
jgi:thiamine pyrophosphokinase